MLKKHQQGIVLLEAMIATLIFAMGVLSLVGLQAVSVSQAADAKIRINASFIANQAIGRLWVADRTKLATYAGTTDIHGQLGVAGSTQKIDVNGNDVTVTIEWTSANRAHQFVTVAHING